MIKNYRFLFTVTMVLVSALAFSQQKLPLKTILAVIEKQHQVKFNYIDDAVKDYKLPSPAAQLSLPEKINHIEKLTPLVFENITSTYITISVKKEETQDIVIQETLPIDLSEVTINNYITSGISKKADGSYSLKPKKMGLLPGLSETDILQTMQQIPGIFSSDETISNINIRGGTHDQNMFLWNGIRMFQTGHFFGLISAFNPNLNDQVSISKNGTSAFYGESVSGLVAISSDLYTDEKYNSGFSSNMVSAEFHSKIKLSPKSRFQYSARRSLTDFFRSPTYKKYYNRIFQNTAVSTLGNDQTPNYTTDETFYFYDFTAQFEQKIGSKHLLKTSLIAIDNSLSLKQSTNGNGESVSKNSNLSQQQLGASIEWQTSWNLKNTSKLQFYASSYTLDGVKESIESNQVLTQKNATLDTGLRLENHHQWSDNFSFNNGYQYNEIGIRNNDKVNLPEFSRKIKDVLHTHALIVETQWNSKNKRSGLITGLRTNYIEEFNKFIIEPRLNAYYRLSKNVQLGLLGEIKSQTASQIVDLQQDFLGIEKRRWLLADNNTNPIQKNSQIELGLTIKNKQWLLTFENFYKKVTGISSRSQSFQNQLEFVKINGDYTVLGSELLIQRNFKHFYTWINYSFNKNNYTFPDFVPRNFANNLEINQSISWAGMYELKDLRFALGAKWFSGKPETTPTSMILPESETEIDYNDPNNSNVSDYFQMNFSASYRWEIKDTCEITTSFSILNLLNKKNVINRYYRINASQTIESVNTYSLGCTPNLSIRVNF